MNGNGYHCLLANGELQEKMSPFFELNNDLTTFVENGRPNYDTSKWKMFRIKLALLCDSQSFADWSVEKVYRKYAFAMQKALLSRFLLVYIVLLLTLAGVDYMFERTFTYKTAVYISISTVFLLTFVFVQSKLMKRRHASVFFVLVMLLVTTFCAASFPVNWLAKGSPTFTMADGLWQIAFVIFSVYLLYPGQLFSTIVYNVLLSSAFIVASSLVLVSNNHFAYSEKHPAPLTSQYLMRNFWSMLISSTLFLFGTNLAGVLIQRSRERSIRRGFLETKACILHKLVLQEESEKMERLIRSIVPSELVLDMKDDCLKNRLGWKTAQVTQTSYVTIISAYINGLTHFPPQFSASEAVKLMNQLFCRLDQLAQEQRAYRIRIHGDEYLAVTGYPDEDADHVKTGIQFAMVFMEIVSNLSECSQLPLDARIGINSGLVYGVLLGKSRVVFDLVGEQVNIARHLQQLCSPGRILVSKSSFSDVGDMELQIEAGPTVERQSTARNRVKIDTVCIKPRTMLSMSGNMGRRQRNGNHQLSQGRRAECLKRLALYANYQCESPYQYFGENKANDYQRQRQTEILIKTKMYTKKQSSQHLIKGDARLLESNNSSGSFMSQHQYPGYGLAVAAGSLSFIQHQSCMNKVTLKFNGKTREDEYHRQEDQTFGLSMLFALLLLIVCAGIQASILPRTMMLLLLFMISFTWIGMMLLVLLAAKLKCLEFNIQSSFTIRAVVILTSIVFIFSVCQANVFCCRLSISNQTAFGPILHGKEHDKDLQCPIPDFIYLSGVLCLILVSIFTALPSFIKLFLLSSVTASFALQVLVTHRSLFDLLDSFLNGPSLRVSHVPSSLTGVICLLSFLLLIFVHARFQEYIQRLEFLWKAQAIENQHDMFVVKETSHNLLKNMVPHHVALHFTDTTYRNPLDLYAQEYNLLGILWVNITDWFPQTTEAPLIVQEGIRALNDAVCEFDEMLRTEKFHELVKVRSITDNYVVAIGMNPHLQDNAASKLYYLTNLIQFGLSMKKKLYEINNNSYDDKLKLKIGVDIGPGFCGVIGGSKPVFDVWGEVSHVSKALMQVANSGQILVSDRVYEITHQQFDYYEQATVNVDDIAVRAMALKEHKGRAAPVKQHSRQSTSSFHQTDSPKDTLNTPQSSLSSTPIQAHCFTNQLYQQPQHNVLQPIPESKKCRVTSETQTPPLPPPNIPKPIPRVRKGSDTVCSQSSNSSFLMHENMVFQMQNNDPFENKNKFNLIDEAVITSDEEALTAGHRNPLYTDNEYDSMVESNANLFIEMAALRSKPTACAPVPPRPPRQSLTRSTSADTKQTASVQQQQHAIPQIPKSKRTSASPSVEGSQRSSQRSTPTSKHLDFPDYKKPSPPILSPTNGTRIDSSRSPQHSKDNCKQAEDNFKQGTLSLGMDSDAYTFDMPNFTDNLNTGSTSAMPMLFRLAKEKNGGMRLKAVTPKPYSRKNAESFVSLIDDSIGPSGDELGDNETDLDEIRMQSDFASDLSDVMISDIEEDCSNFFEYVPQAYSPLANESAVHPVNALPQFNNPWNSPESPPQRPSASVNQNQKQNENPNSVSLSTPTSSSKLPDVAPVLMPDFSHIGAYGHDNDEMETSTEFADMELNSYGNSNDHRPDADVLLPVIKDDRQARREKEALEKRKDRFKRHMYGRGTSSDKSDYENGDTDYTDAYTDGEEGYNCDVPSSAYESQVESEYDEDYFDYDNALNQRRSGNCSASGKSDYDNMDSDFSERVRKMLNTTDIFQERIAQEARRISNVVENNFYCDESSNKNQAKTNGHGHDKSFEPPDYIIKSDTLAILLAPMAGVSHPKSKMQRKIEKVNQPCPSKHKTRYGSLERDFTGTKSRLKRNRSLDELSQLHRLNGVNGVAASNGAYQKFVARHGKMRNIVPAELQRYILPGCISSSSLATSVGFPSDPSMHYSTYESEYDNFFDGRRMTQV